MTMMANRRLRREKHETQSVLALGLLVLLFFSFSLWGHGNRKNMDSKQDSSRIFDPFLLPVHMDVFPQILVIRKEKSQNP